MSDYKRETYYLYNYEDGRKRNNIGFSRVEQMNGKCKITSRIRVPSMNGKSLEVCLFIRERGELRFLPIGKMQISNMTGELRTMLNSDDIMGMGYGMEEIKGMVIYDSLQKFFGSEWDDHRIVFKKFQLAEKKKGNGQNHFMETVSNKDSIQGWEKVTAADHTMLQAASFTGTDFYREEEIEQKESEKREQAETPAVSSYKEIQEMGKMTEILPEPPIPEPPIMEEVQKKQEKKEDENEKKKISDQKEELWEKRKMIREQKEEMGERRTQEQQLQERVQIQNSELAKMDTNRPFSGDLPKIFYQFPQMYPFEDNEMTDCVRIEPQDIGRLPMESWILANNSFLLHSYYSYRHLLLARRNRGSGFEYVICAPGICQHREQFMAAMFGFCDFKPAKNVEDKNGEFGYWYMPVLIED